MIIFIYKGLTRNLEIGNTRFWVFLNIWRRGRVRDTNFGRNVSNKKLLNTAKCQGFNIFRFWAIKRKPTGVKLPPNIQIRFKKRSGLIIEPWGTPALTFTHAECWTFRIIFCVLAFRKFVKVLSKLRTTPVCFKYFLLLSIRPFYQTLSKVLDMSRKTPLTSKPLTKDWHVSWAIDNNWLIQNIYLYIETIDTRITWHKTRLTWFHS